MDQQLDCLYLRFFLTFKEPVLFDINPLFLIRSLLGKELRRFCCSQKGLECVSCPLKEGCAYVFLFESLKPKNSEILPGLDKSSHPFILKETESWPHNATLSYSFGLTLLGKAVSYFPYVYIALTEAGKYGVLRARTPYVIERVLSKTGEELLHEDGNIPYRKWLNVWKPFPSTSSFVGDILISLCSPLRFKHQGSYGNDFSELDFYHCLRRRLSTVLALFGTGADTVADWDGSGVSFRSRELDWVDYSHYSARQKSSMHLGGSMGSFVLQGTFDSNWLTLLDFSEHFNAGKNVSFGLGTIELWKKGETQNV